jgi:DNA-binding FadR family transcriptional regulator
MAPVTFSPATMNSTTRSWTMAVVTADYFEYRRIIEGQAAALAATRATDVDRAALKVLRTDRKGPRD